MGKLFKVIAKLVAVFVALFSVTFTIYYLNLDMKLVRKIYDLLGKHYDEQEKDRQL